MTPHSIDQKIKQRLTEVFSPAHLQLIDESAGHHTQTALPTHFKVILVSDRFENLARVKRHQTVYRALGDDIMHAIHALALHLYTPDEWTKQGQNAPQTPTCRGGFHG